MLGRRDVSQPIHTPFPYIFWRDVRVICSRDGSPRGVREGEKTGVLESFPWSWINDGGGADARLRRSQTRRQSHDCLSPSSDIGLIVLKSLGSAILVPLTKKAHYRFIFVVLLL